jgi:glutathione S-transferase|tara:strand:- start:99 stop:287 length:189 start_codon:yes stop_codon:yes gene_type:complete
MCKPAQGNGRRNMYILYGGCFTRTLMVEMVMVEGDISYELLAVDILKNEHRTPEFLSINPAG